MTYRDDLNKILDTRDVDYAKLVTDLNKALATINDMQSALNASELKYAAYVAAHPDPKSTIYGFNISPGDTFNGTGGTKESDMDQAARLINTFGSLNVAKLFSMGDDSPSWKLSQSGLDLLIVGKTVMIGFKPNQTNLALGRYDQAIQNFCEMIPAGWKVLLVNWQEPDNEMWVDNPPKFSSSLFRSATDQLCKVVQATNAYKVGRVEVWLVFMEYSLNVGRFNKACVSDLVDGIGWDFYLNSTTEGKNDPSARVQKMADAFAPKPWGIFEAGDRQAPTAKYPIPTFANGAARVAQWTKVFNAVENTKARYFCWFNALGTTGDHRMIPGQAMSEPLIKEYTKRVKASAPPVTPSAGPAAGVRRVIG